MVLPPPRRSPAVTALAVVIAILLVAGALAIGTVEDPAAPAPLAHDDRGTTVAVTPQGVEGDAAGTAGAIAESIPALMRFVERARGLAFTKPVNVTLLPDSEFRQRLRRVDETSDDASERRERVRTNERVLRALGLLDGDADLVRAGESLVGDAVAGYYDTEKDDLVVRGDELSAGVKVTFVHELTHALQDQHFDLHRDDLEERDDEASQSFTALVEGDAVRIEEMYLDSLPVAEQKAAEQEEAEAASRIDPSTPRVLLQLVSYPYVIGPRFTSQLVRDAGQARLDEAFRTPPTTSEQILHPERYLADGEEPRVVENPQADGTVIDQGVLGELLFILILQRLVDPDVAALAARGWGGDRYVAWRDGDDACVRANLVMDTASDEREMRKALLEAERKNDDLDVTATPSLLTFTSCG